MVHVPAGPFEMGSTSGGSDERPVHTVELSGYWIDKYEVTNAQYGAYVSTGGGAASKLTNDGTYNGPQQPVVGVSWNDAVGYCTWAGLRLPTEAQWEKAARGTDGRTYPWENGTAKCARAVMYEGGDGCGRGSGAWNVGSKPAGVSPYGAHDMAGNVWEWVADWYDSGYYAVSPSSNPTGPSSGSTRVLRGGSWGLSAINLRAAVRDRLNPTSRINSLGFRCAQDE